MPSSGVRGLCGDGSAAVRRQQGQIWPLLAPGAVPISPRSIPLPPRVPCAPPVPPYARAACPVGSRRRPRALPPRRPCAPRPCQRQAADASPTTRLGLPRTAHAAPDPHALEPRGPPPLATSRYCRSSVRTAGQSVLRVELSVPQLLSATQSSASKNAAADENLKYFNSHTRRMFIFGDWSVFQRRNWKWIPTTAEHARQSTAKDQLT